MDEKRWERFMTQMETDVEAIKVKLALSEVPAEPVAAAEVPAEPVTPPSSSSKTTAATAAE